MGGDVVQRRQFLLDATQGMSADAVVYLVQAAAATENQTVSHSMVRLLAKLAKHADTEVESRRAMADRSLRDTVTRLVNEWSLADPNPDAYRAVLEHASRTTAPAVGMLAAQQRAGLRAGAHREDGARDRRRRRHAVARRRSDGARRPRRRRCST